MRSSAHETVCGSRIDDHAETAVLLDDEEQTTLAFAIKGDTKESEADKSANKLHICLSIYSQNFIKIRLVGCIELIGALVVKISHALIITLRIMAI